MTQTQILQDEATEQKPRFEPIENPGNLKLKAAYWFSEKKMGKVITPLKVVYARYPDALGLARKIAETDEQFTLDRELKYLVKTYIATLNGCAFCIDIAKASAQTDNIENRKFEHLLKYDESPLFSEREKAALAYVEEITRHIHVGENTFERLSRHFTEEEIVQLTLLNAIENYYNMVSAPLNIGSDELCKLWD